MYVADKDGMKTMAITREEKKRYLREKLHMVKITHCSKCNTAYTADDYIGFECFKCPECGNEDMTNFGKIHRYLEINKNATMFQISNDLNIGTDEITEYLRKSRLEMTENSSIFLACEGCGTSIKSGRFCENCFKKGTVRGVYSEIGDKPKSTGKMRYLK